MTTPVSSTLAKLLIEKGMVIHHSIYHKNNNLVIHEYPTIAEVVMWLYEKHGVWIYVDNNRIHKWWHCVHFINSPDKYDKSQFNTPTEAYESAIEYALNNLL